MSRLPQLIKGEFTRLNKYNLLAANIVVLLFYIAVGYFYDIEILVDYIPLIIYFDAALMTVLMVGSIMFYEKKENTISTMLISPATDNEILLSKIITSILNSLLSLVILSVAVYFLNDITLNYLHLSIAIIIVSSFHALIGVALTYITKDFSSLLMTYMSYVVITLIPTILVIFGVITNQTIIDILVILPSEASYTMFSSAGNMGANTGEIQVWKVIFSAIYVTLISLVGYIKFIKPKFQKYAMKETGV